MYRELVSSSFLWHSILSYKYLKSFAVLGVGSNVSCIMLKMAKRTLKILQGSHQKTFKVCLTILQHYA